MKNSTVGKLAMVVGLLGVGALGLYLKDRYFDVVEMKRVTITGLPCPTGNLVTPIVIEGTMEGSNFGLSYSGGASGHATPLTLDVTLPANAKHEVTVRVGYCRAQGGGNWSCEHPTWIDHKQIVTVDTRLPDPTLTLGIPGEHACR